MPRGRKTCPGLADLDLQFHDTLLELSGFQGLHRIWRSMDGLVRARTYATLALPGRGELIEYTAGSHRPIVEAIRSGDPDAVEQAVKDHIHEVPSLMAGKMPSAAPPDLTEPHWSPSVTSRRATRAASLITAGVSICPGERDAEAPAEDHLQP